MCFLFFFFFTDTATTEIYTLSLHDALPILWHEMLEPVWSTAEETGLVVSFHVFEGGGATAGWRIPDRKSTRLNSSHSSISYAVFCLKKKKKKKTKYVSKKLYIT